jgi:predicted outer membrane repeat protein
MAFAVEGTVVLSDVVVQNNTAGDRGGGIYCSSGEQPADWTLDGVTLRENEAGLTGGGAALAVGDLSMHDVLIESNSSGGDAGGIEITTSNGEIDLVDTSVVANLGLNAGGIDLQGYGSASLTVSGSLVAGNEAGLDGGGLRVDGVSTLVVDAEVSGNVAGRWGGGLSVSGSCPSSIQGLLLVGNEADAGGGVHLSACDDTVTVTEVVIQANEAVQGAGLFAEGLDLVLTEVDLLGNVAVGQGGGLLVGDGASLEATDVSFVGNQAWAFGVPDYGEGGAALVGDGAAACAFHGAQFEGNEAAVSGGAIHQRGGSLTITDSSFVSNSTTASMARGGAIGTEPSTQLTVTNTSFEANVSAHECGAADLQGESQLDNVSFTANTLVALTAGNGGAACLRGPSELDTVVFADNWASSGGAVDILSATVDMDQTVFVGNFASWRGGGIRCRGSCTLSLANSIFVGNEVNTRSGAIHLEGAGTVTASHTAVWANTPDDDWDPIGSNGNVALDPAFLDYDPTADPADWDLHLSSTSPLIDAGDPAILDPDGSPSDIGLYGGAGAGLWDLDGDGSPAWWHPGAYATAVDPAAGWDCDDGDPDVFPGQGC